MMSWNCDAIFLLQNRVSCRFLFAELFADRGRHNVPISYVDGIRSVKVSGKKVNVALDKELRGR
jgi:hypothetical protein